MLLIVAVGALQLMLDLGKEHDWFESAEIWALAIIAVVGLAAFLIWESTERHPIVDLRVFRPPRLQHLRADDQHRLRQYRVDCRSLDLARGRDDRYDVLAGLGPR